MGRECRVRAWPHRVQYFTQEGKRPLEAAGWPELLEKGRARGNTPHEGQGTGVLLLRNSVRPAKAAGISGAVEEANQTEEG